MAAGGKFGYFKDARGGSLRTTRIRRFDTRCVANDSGGKILVELANQALGGLS
jgi:hypothetical protein